MVTMDKKALSRYFKAFSDLSRLTILELLARKDLTVNEITAQMGLTQSAVSRHLGILRAAEVVEATRDGQNVIYSLNKEKVCICCDDFCCNLNVTSETKGKKSKK
ncbi:MAG: metalloregulator ArsR/SmtB family transcription factor [Candidatus Zixiibacteriota bacterium]